MTTDEVADLKARAHLILLTLLGLGGAGCVAWYADGQPSEPPEAPVPRTYDDVLAYLQALRPGVTRSAIVAAIGLPTETHDDTMSYSLMKLAGYPGIPRPGMQVFPGATIEMRFGKVLRRVQFAWIDATGPAPSAEPSGLNGGTH